MHSLLDEALEYRSVIPTTWTSVSANWGYFKRLLYSFHPASDLDTTHWMSGDALVRGKVPMKLSSCQELWLKFIHIAFHPHLAFNSTKTSQVWEPVKKWPKRDGAFLLFPLKSQVFKKSYMNRRKSKRNIFILSYLRRFRGGFLVALHASFWISTLFEFIFPFVEFRDYSLQLHN